MLEKFRRFGRIDKSVLTHGTPPRVEDEAYRRTAPQHACEACLCPGATGRVVGAHVRTGNEGGAGFKPSDDLLVWLCDVCHADQESKPGPWWWIERIFKPWLRRRYQAWKAATMAKG